MPTANYKGTLKGLPCCGFQPPRIEYDYTKEAPTHWMYSVRLARGQKNTVEYSKELCYWWVPPCGKYHSAGWGKRARKYICVQCAQGLGWEW